MTCNENDKLELQHLAGVDIVAQPPIFGSNGELLFIMGENVVRIYASKTGEFVRQLMGVSKGGKLISMEFDIKQPNILVCCSDKGEVLRWQWQTGKLGSQKMHNFPETTTLASFNLLNLYRNTDYPYAFVTYKTATDSRYHWCVMEISCGTKLDVPANFKLETYEALPMVAVDNRNFNNICIAQKGYVFFINYKTWKHRRWMNAHKVAITCVRNHPTEEMFATGDERGRIFLWRQFLGHAQNVTTSLYHWHHTAVTSLAFSASGMSFYSSGLESVLVKWNLVNAKQKEFLPRTTANIRHIAVCEETSEAVICTADNSVQIIGNDTQFKNSVQEFTYIADDKTGKSKFPVGLRVNPRTNTLVLNGRVGHLQFYSVYSKFSKKLLYNMDIVCQNKLSEETDKILYNIQVTKAAFNIDWMATGEVFNDEQHLPELRLKFWKYDETNQSYTLNTNIELPHEGGFKAIEFSSDYQMGQLLCATVGDDNVIKMWALDETENIYRSGKVWYCIAQTSYKNLPIESINFSQDGSLLAAGFCNTLCIYKADNLRLKAALTGSAALDGSLQKVQVKVSRNVMKDARTHRNRLLQLFSKLLESNDETLIKEIKKSIASSVNTTNQHLGQNLSYLDEQQKAAIYKKIMRMNEMNLMQKILLFQKLGIQGEVSSQMKSQFIDYLCNSSMRSNSGKLEARLHRINLKDRFKAKLRLNQFNKPSLKSNDLTPNLISIMSVLNLNDTTKLHSAQLTNGFGGKETNKSKTANISNSEKKKPSKASAPIMADITHVRFAAGEYAHLVVVCTQTRVLIWNLLTLRIQSVLRLSVEHLAFDPHTNIIAAFTKHNNLFVFQPNVPLPIYERRNLPKLHGAVWLPRRHPKNKSINLDWQSQSTLYLLTENQSIMYLSESTSKVDSPPAITFANAASMPDGLRYTTFGTFATKQTTDIKSHSTTHKGGPLVNSNSGKTAIRTLIEMSTHTMPPLNLLCGDFVKSLVKPSESSIASANANLPEDNLNKTNGSVEPEENADYEMAESDIEDSGVDSAGSKTQSTRKVILAKAEDVMRTYAKTKLKNIQNANMSERSLMQRFEMEQLDIEF